MAENLDFADLNLLCSESTIDFDCGEVPVDEFGLLPQNNLNIIPDSNFNYIRSDSLMGFPLLNEEIIREMVQKEKYYMPKDDYIERLRCGAREWSVRKEALDWVLKVVILANFYQTGFFCLLLFDPLILF